MDKIVDIISIARPVNLYNRQENLDTRRREIIKKQEDLKKRAKEILREKK